MSIVHPRTISLSPFDGTNGRTPSQCIVSLPSPPLSPPPIAAYIPPNIHLKLSHPPSCKPHQLEQSVIHPSLPKHTRYLSRLSNIQRCATAPPSATAAGASNAAASSHVPTSPPRPSRRIRLPRSPRTTLRAPSPRLGVSQRRRR